MQSKKKNGGIILVKVLGIILGMICVGVLGGGLIAGTLYGIYGFFTIINPLWVIAILLLLMLAVMLRPHFALFFAIRKELKNKDLS